MSAPDVADVIDVAAGAQWHFPIEYKTGYGLHITGIDIDEEALKMNQSLDKMIVRDVCEGGPFGNFCYDIVTCYSGIEHFSDVDKFLENSFASLREGGALIAQFPSSLAPFAILNRALPEGLKTNLLRHLHPSKVGEIGYPAVYHRCKYSAFRQSAEKCGFCVEYYLPSYMSSGYFYPFFPAFLISLMADYFRLIFGSRDMASYNLFVLRRPGPHFPLKWSWHAV